MLDQSITPQVENNETAILDKGGPMAVELRIKAKSLAAESRIIRLEERKMKHRARRASDHQKEKAAAWAHEQRHKLYSHRIGAVRPEARATHLARAFASGRNYRSVEASTRPGNKVTKAMYTKIRDMLARYGHSFETADLEAWFEEETPGNSG